MAAAVTEGRPAHGLREETLVREIGRGRHGELIDTTGMYLRTVYELEEEGWPR